jgi:hypothetical protein
LARIQFFMSSPKWLMAGPCGEQYYCFQILNHGLAAGAIMKLNDLPFPPVSVAAPGVDACAARDCAELIGRRLWRGDHLERWMTCVPELALAAAGAAHLSALVCEEAAGLIANTLLALSREPEEARSGKDDIETLMCAVSRCDPPLRNGRRLSTCDCESGSSGGDHSGGTSGSNTASGRNGRNGCGHHALACALAVGAVRGMLSSVSCRASPNLRLPPSI